MYGELLHCIPWIYLIVNKKWLHLEFSMEKWLETEKVSFNDFGKNQNMYL